MSSAATGKGILGRSPVSGFVLLRVEGIEAGSLALYEDRRRRNCSTGSEPRVRVDMPDGELVTVAGTVVRMQKYAGAVTF